jgi:hypothetical protein
VNYLEYQQHHPFRGSISGMDDIAGFGLTIGSFEGFGLELGAQQGKSGDVTASDRGGSQVRRGK